MDVADGVGEVAIMVDRGGRGRGYARRMLHELLWLVGDEGLASWLVAEVHEQNLPSLRAFRHAGFADVGRRGEFLKLRWEAPRKEPPGAAEPRS
jgi:L-amino acid N-acyltransferase YncA